VLPTPARGVKCLPTVPIPAWGFSREWISIVLMSLAFCVPLSPMLKLAFSPSVIVGPDRARRDRSDDQIWRARTGEDGVDSGKQDTRHLEPGRQR
jgi:hypothetical protein